MATKCRKRRYRDELAAKIALSETNRRAKAKQETRYYKCERCHGFHLTSR